MGILVGNFLSAILIAIIVGIEHDSIEKVTLIFLIAAYGIWLVFALMDRLGRPKDSDFSRRLEPEELIFYRKYHTAIDFPLPGQVYAGILNFLRVAGLIFTGLCIWKALYPEAAGAFAFFLISAPLIHRNHPWLFLGQRADKGHPRAKTELTALEALIQKRLGTPTKEEP
jgi:hypothetical protein